MFKLVVIFMVHKGIIMPATDQYGERFDEQHIENG